MDLYVLLAGFVLFVVWVSLTIFNIRLLRKDIKSMILNHRIEVHKRNSIRNRKNDV